jgi:hypothetical protein
MSKESDYSLGRSFRIKMQKESMGASTKVQIEKELKRVNELKT